ncbi:hypothetical protein PENTCL1PPCAC_9816, partial [Pristionchus entomophagus]
CSSSSVRCRSCSSSCWIAPSGGASTHGWWLLIIVSIVHRSATTAIGSRRCYCSSGSFVFAAPTERSHRRLDACCTHWVSLRTAGDISDYILRRVPVSSLK